jgi:hypothetical protein
VSGGGGGTYSLTNITAAAINLGFPYALFNALTAV